MADQLSQEEKQKILDRFERRAAAYDYDFSDAANGPSGPPSSIKLVKDERFQGPHLCGRPRPE
jgi:hypothetical protein